MSEDTYLLFYPISGEYQKFANKKIRNFTERHKLKIERNVKSGEKIDNILEYDGLDNIQGVFIEQFQGLPTINMLNAIRGLLARNLKCFIYWPNENVAECVDEEKIRSLKVHRYAYTTLRGFVNIRKYIKSIVSRCKNIPRLSKSKFTKNRHRYDGHNENIGVYSFSLERLQEIFRYAKPILFPHDFSMAKDKKKGVGIYLRLDYWANINSGGSYGHTCYVAKNLSDSSSEFIILNANNYELMNDMGLAQVVLKKPPYGCSEIDLLNANDHYYNLIKLYLIKHRPAYIYERLCLGSYVGAQLANEFGIPYIVEYNGSEISMRKSFGDGAYKNEDLFLNLENCAFNQAAVISVVSEVVRDNLLERGVDPSKILVNPNGVDCEVYQPASEEMRILRRKELNLKSDDIVIAFVGTFGGWHGIDTLAAVIPVICDKRKDVKFLLIGDGPKKYLIDDMVGEEKIQGKIIMTGKVPQKYAYEKMLVADIFVSPHNSHMVDSKFFGSPTKIFEYMAVGGGIVASDLEQIGQILSPSLRASDFKNGIPEVRNHVAVLFEPGNVDEFVNAILRLCENPRVRKTIGDNARRKVKEQYTWNEHIARLWQFIDENKIISDDEVKINNVETLPASPEIIQADDEYKEQVQNQWDNNPCGSQYVENSEQHTLEWYKEVEDYRYKYYAPWMYEVMEFANHGGENLLEIGAGIGTDHAQFAMNGAITTDIDLSSGHLALAKENFKLRGLDGTFIHHDAENLPFEENTFDIIYSNGVIHHTPNTKLLIDEIYRVLRPGGKIIIMVYAENSYHYWMVQFYKLGIMNDMLDKWSMGEIMSRNVEITENDARPLVKVYTKKRLANLFNQFENISIVQQQFTKGELPKAIKWASPNLMGRYLGWNLIIKANKPLNVGIH